jgi:hypothetical protein
MHMLSKFLKKSAQKLLIFPIKAGYARSLLMKNKRMSRCVLEPEPLDVSHVLEDVKFK